MLNFTSNATDSTKFSLEATYLGKIPYATAYEMQLQLWSYAKDRNQFSVMGLEHPAVVTLGRRAQDKEIMTALSGVEIAQSTRGGLATIHSEGQLVIYPIVNLRTLGLGVKDYVQSLLETTQKTFADFEIKTEVDADKVGLYTQTGKIVFCGLEIRNGVSLHGLSVNIENDLNLFGLIRSCGVHQMSVDSLRNYRTDVSLKQFYTVWLQNFKKTLSEFDLKLLNSPQEHPSGQCAQNERS